MTKIQLFTIILSGLKSTKIFYFHTHRQFGAYAYTDKQTNKIVHPLVLCFDEKLNHFTTYFIYKVDFYLGTMDGSGFQKILNSFLVFVLILR